MTDVSQAGAQPPAPPQAPPPTPPAPRASDPGAAAGRRSAGAGPNASCRDRPGRALDRAALPPNQRIAHRAADLSVLHPGAGEPPERRRVGALYRRHREGPARRLQAPLGHQLPGQPVGGSERRSVPERGRRQAGDLPHGGAPARQDRRLHRLVEGRAYQGRREDEGARDLAPARFLPRRRRRSAGQGNRPRPHGRKGLRVRGGEFLGRAAARRSQARQGGFRRAGGPTGQGPGDQLRRERGGQRRHPEAPDEVDQGGVVPLVDYRARQIPGGQVRGGRRSHRRVLPEPRLRAGPCRPAGPEGPRGQRQQGNPLRAAGHSGRRGSPLQGRQVRVRRQHRHQVRLPAAGVQTECGRLVQREADSRRADQVAGDVRRRRLLRVHGLSRTCSSRTPPRAPSPGPPSQPST